MDDIKEIYSVLILGIKDYFKKNNADKAVIGLSGGIDSTVAVNLIVKSIGNENVFTLLMPEIGITSKRNLKDAEEIAKKLKIKYFIKPINDFLKPFESLQWKQDKYAIANTKARIRANILYNFANANKALVVGTSNKSEIALGYSTKYGDMAADILILGDLWKTEVLELAKFLKIPKKIINKKPTAELLPEQTDEKELGAPYSILDKIMQLYIEDDLSVNEIIEKGFNRNLVKNIVNKIRINEHKRKPPVLIRISERSFHSQEWRMPITNKYEE